MHWQYEYSLRALIQHLCNTKVIYHKSFTTTQIDIVRPGVKCFPDLLGIFLGTLEIRLGEHIRSSTSDSSITRDFKVSTMTSHPQYNGNSHDIALVKHTQMFGRLLQFTNEMFR